MIRAEGSLASIAKRIPIISMASDGCRKNPSEKNVRGVLDRFLLGLMQAALTSDKRRRFHRPCADYAFAVHAWYYKLEKRLHTLANGT